MAKKEAKKLAFDVACGFFTEDQLLTRYNLSLSQLKNIKSQRAFMKQVDETNRLLKDDGSEFLIRAKEYAMEVLEAMHEIALDTSVGEANRIKAGEKIFGLAKLLHLPSKGDGGMVGSLLINTNLALNQLPEGSYQLEAKPVAQITTLEGEFQRVNEKQIAGADLV
jgi:hypothetical protein